MNMSQIIVRLMNRDFMNNQQFQYFLGIFVESIPYLFIIFFVILNRYVQSKHKNSNLATNFEKVSKIFGLVLIIAMLISLVFGVRYMNLVLE